MTRSTKTAKTAKTIKAARASKQPSKQPAKPAAAAAGQDYRVYRLPKALRVAASQARTAAGQTVADFVQQAVNQELPGLLGDLRLVFNGRHHGQLGPARLPVSADTLAGLKAASEIGVPASLLLELCLTRASAAAVKAPAKAPAKRGRKVKN